MKTAKLFRNGQSQAVRLPKEFRFEGDEVFIKKSGSAVVLIPLVNSRDSLTMSDDVAFRLALAIACKSREWCRR